MYRIEVAPGEESVFRTIEELAVGIRNGVVTPRARIYHHASQKWLPIGLHPHYKKALEMPAAKASHPSEKIPRLSAPPVPRTAPRVEPTPAAETPRMIPPPVQSPIVAMQREVLRDLPVVAIPEPVATSSGPDATSPRPEPLPWSPPAPRVAAPPPPRPVVPAHPAVKGAPTSLAEPLAERTAPAAEPRPGGTALEPHHAPLEDAAPARPTARRSPRMNGRPMLLVGVAAALVIGTHFALTPTRPAGRAEPTVPADNAGSSVTRAAGERPQPGPPPRATTDPARVPMTPGPAFAGSVPLVQGSNLGAAPSTIAGAATSAATLPEPGDADAPAAPTIAPPPAQLDLTMPVPPAESIAPQTRTGDTLAMKRILRALNGANQR